MMRVAFLAALALLALATLTPAARAQGNGARVALVIGNAAYKAQPLANPVNDARAMARTLEQVGFQVVRVEDAGHREMTRAVTNFGRRAAAGSGAGGRVALFYYAGHGVQVRGRNYLVPVDADITSEASVVSESVDVDNILAQMAGPSPAAGAGDGSRLNLVILDACRNNPFEGRFRSAGAGLAAIDAPKGTLIAYATAPGRVAADGERRNGFYTEHLLRAMQMPGLKVEELFKQVRIDVARATGDSQIPWEASSLTGDFYFRPPVAPPPPAVDPATVEMQLWRRARESGKAEHYREYLARYPQGEFAEMATARLAPPAPPPPAAAPPAADPAIAELQLWRRARDSGRPAHFREYLARYPQGEFAELAKLRLERLGTPEASAPPKPGAPRPQRPPAVVNSPSAAARADRSPTTAGEQRLEPGSASASSAGRVLVVSRIPYLDDFARARVAAVYPGLAGSKALAIDRSGAATWSGGVTTAEAIRRALQHCEIRSREGCALYAS